MIRKSTSWNDRPTFPKSFSALSSEPHRQHRSEYIDDVMQQCNSLKFAAEMIQKAARETDERRRAGKTWDSGAVNRELTKADTALRRIWNTVDRMNEE